MTKIAIKNENITSFGGIIALWTFSLSWALKNSQNLSWANVGVVIGLLVMEAFSVLSSSATFVVANALRDINVLIGQFKQRPDTLLPGADTMGCGLKELAEKNIVYKSETSDKSYSFNTAEKLNTLLLRMIQRIGLIKVGSHVDMNFDHQFIPAHKFDAKYSLNKQHVFMILTFLIGLGGGISCLCKNQEAPKNIISTYRATKRHLNTQNHLTRKSAAELRIYIEFCFTITLFITIKTK